MPCVWSRTRTRIRTLFALCRALRHGQFLARMVQAENWLYSAMAMQVACSPMTALIRTWSPGLGLRQCGNCEKLADGLRLGLGVARCRSVSSRLSPPLSRFGWSRSPSLIGCTGCGVVRCTVSESLTVSGFTCLCRSPASYLPF